MASKGVEMKAKGSDNARLPLSDKIKTLINNILSSSDLIKAVLLTTQDGFTIAYASNNGSMDIDPKWLGALMISSLKNFEKNMKRILGNSNITDVFLTTDDEIILIRELGRLILIVIADKYMDIYALFHDVIDNSLDLIRELELKV